MASGNIGIIILRLFFGLAFVVAGLDKILSFSSAKGMFISLFGALGVFMLVVAIIIELIGGLALLANVRAKWASGALAVFMVAALVSTFKVGDAPNVIAWVRELLVMNTGGSNVPVTLSYLAGLLAIFFSVKK